jgi:predicted GH43/DUF377 family glycosyl hydrolase
MNARAFSLLVVLMLVAPAVPALAAGPWIEVSSYKDGDVLTVKTVDIAGSAEPTPDGWYQHLASEFKSGSFNNATLTKGGAIADDPYLSSFTKDANNPIIDLGGVGSANEFGIVIGSVIKDGGTYKMWAMALNNSTVYNIVYLDSTDGSSWNATNGTLDLGAHGAFDEMAIWPGTVIKEGATYKMWYTGQGADQFYRIGYATSTDGITWTKGNNGKAVLDIGPVNKFDGGGTSSPAVIKDGGKYKMWYSGMISYSNNLYQVGYATSADGTAWTRENNGDPVLSFGKGSAFDGNALYGDVVIKDGETYRMWYIGLPSQSVGYATSADGVNWAKGSDESSVLSPDGGTFDAVGIRGLAVLRVGNNYDLYYTGMDSMGQTRLGLAQANIEGLNGIYQSDIFAGDFTVDWNEVNVTADTPTGSSVTIATRSSNDRVDWTVWKGPVKGNNGWKNAKYMQYMLTLTSSDGLNIPKVSAVKLEFEAIERVEVSTDNSTWYLATGTTQWNITLFLREGPNKVFVRMMDTTNVPTYTMMNLVVDTLRPMGIIQLNSESMYTTNTTVHLAIAATDARGVTKMRLGTMPDLANATWHNFTTGLDYQLPAVDGIVTVYAQVIDTTGWVSNVFSDSIILDTTPPNATVVINGGAPMTTFQAVTLGLTATDINGVTDMRISNDPDPTGAEWTPYTRVVDWQLEASDGPKTVHVEFRDSAGNTKAFSATVKLDTTAPAGTIVINNGDAITADQVVILTLTTTDNNGVAYVMVSNQPDFLLGSWANYDKTMSWKLPEKLGPQTVYAKFKDTAGLVSPVVSASIILDIHEEGFHGSILINSGDAYSSNQTLNVTLDLIGGDAQTTVMLAEGQDFTGATWVPYASAMSLKVSNADGQATVYAKFKDRYGIVSPVVSDTILIDTAAPTVTILTPKMNVKVTSDRVTITGTASDNHGLRTVEVQLPNGAWMPVDNPKSFSLDVYLPNRATYTLPVRAIDQAGNVGTTTITIKYVKAQDNGVRIPGFEAGAVIIVALALVLVLARRRKE